METSICPSCGETVELGERTWLGQTLVCPHCEEMLKVVELDPCELDWALDEEDDEWEDEDWEDEDWEDEDDD